jgi:hypothetical protein
LKGGPLGSVLNGAAPYQDQICASVAVSPVLVILRYADSTRRFIVVMGGCPGIVLNDGTKLIFANNQLRRTASILGLP